MSRKTDLRQFNAVEVGQLDADMWRAYYEKKPGKLFLQLSRLMRRQFHAPYWRSLSMAWYAGKAAFVFKEGSRREEYARALPYLERYYSAVNRLSNKPFEVQKVAQLELEWWIIRREPACYSPADWERILAEEAGEMYHLPAGRFTEYARQRTKAMLLRDAKGEQITEEDWAKINSLLQECWTSLYRSLNEKGRSD